MDDASAELTVGRGGDEALTVGALPRGAAAGPVQPAEAAPAPSPSPGAAATTSTATTSTATTSTAAQPSPLQPCPLQPSPSPPPLQPLQPQPPRPPPTAAPPAPSTPDTRRMLHPSQPPSNASATVACVADSCTPGSNPATTPLPVGQPTPTPQSPPAAALRKTSPGLAARLKALGFGSATKSSAASLPPESVVGRLDQHQLRRLDEKHQAASFASIITRRGRPWKGNSNPVATHPLPEADSWGPFAVAMDPAKPTPTGSKAHHPPSPTDADSTAPPPPKDPIALPLTPPIATGDDGSQDDDYVADLSSYFSPSRNRPGSIYTLSRASFASQLAQLTSLQLPDAQSLSSKVSAIRNAQVAAKALMNAAEQIQSWISKAQEVVGGLDSDDDVEWAAAGGREGLHEVESAIGRFEHVIKAYVGSIEELQSRPDIGSVAAQDLNEAVGQMEAITDAWGSMRNALRSVGSQVETAMEWEELWNSVLGDIQDEMEELSRLVFEMEERRHQAAAAAAAAAADDDDSKVADQGASAKRLSIVAVPTSPSSPHDASQGLSADDSNLLGLFARMQPLRASLDFLPMRLHAFSSRATGSFPTACEELAMRHAALDGRYAKLEADASALRKELGEDRWVVVFRGAGRQAQRMQQSVQRTLARLGDAVQRGEPLAAAVDGYEAKKRHYAPAIERVLAIIDAGVRDRLTVNGEVLRLHAHLQTAWLALRRHMAHMDALLLRLDRDSASTRASHDGADSSPRATPASSPPESLVRTARPVAPSHASTPAPRPSLPRPRWNSSTNTASLDTGHNFSPLSPTLSRLPIRTFSPASSYTTTTTTPQSRSRLRAPTPISSAPCPPPRSLSKPRLAPKSSMSALLASSSSSSLRRTSMQPFPLDPIPPRQPARPATAMATQRRSSSILAPASLRRNRPLEPKDLKPRWRN